MKTLTPSYSGKYLSNSWDSGKHHTLSLNNEYAETDLQKANMLNKYFSSQSVVDDNNKSMPPPQTEITPQAVKDIFGGLDVNNFVTLALWVPASLKKAPQFFLNLIH